MDYEEWQPSDAFNGEDSTGEIERAVKELSELGYAEFNAY
jgi:hypothetical protein